MEDKCHRCEWLPWETAVWSLTVITCILLAFCVLVNLTTPSDSSGSTPPSRAPIAARWRLRFASHAAGLLRVMQPAMRYPSPRLGPPKVRVRGPRQTLENGTSRRLHIFTANRAMAHNLAADLRGAHAFTSKTTEAAAQ